MLDWLKGAALVAFIGLCITVAIDEHRTSKHLDRLLMSSTDTVEVTGKQIPLVQQDIHSTSVALTTAAQAIPTTLNQVRLDLKPLIKQANLDLQATHRVLLEAGLTAMEARKASAEERAALPAITGEVEKSITSFDADLVTLQTLIIHGDKLVSDPHIPAAIAHTDAAMGHVEGAVADVQHVTHQFAYPGIWSKVKGIALDIAHVFNPL